MKQMQLNDNGGANEQTKKDYRESLPDTKCFMHGKEIDAEAKKGMETSKAIGDNKQFEH